MIGDIREVFAGARRKGFVARFFELGGKFRLDYQRKTLGELRDRRRELGRHFQAVMKIAFRGKRGGRKEKWVGILAFLYWEGLIKAGDKIRVTRGIFEGILEAKEELERLETAVAEIYGEERCVFGNSIEIADDEESEELEQGFDGEGREEFGGMCAEEWFYRKILLPEVIENGGSEAEIIPQLRFSSLVDGEIGSGRRMDFFLMGDEGKGMVIEVDDLTHEKRSERDLERDKLIRANRLRTFRIKDGELEDIQKARKKLRRALKGLYEASKTTQKEHLDVEGINNALMLKNRSERVLEGFNGKIYVGDELENEVLVQEVVFLNEIVNFKIERKIDNEVGKEWGKLELALGEKVREGLEWLIKYIFGFEGFREGQLEAIVRILRGEDTIVLLPTGSGKSVVYHLLSLILPGVGVIVEPLRALMEDQVMNLKKRGIDTAINFSQEMTTWQKRRMMKLVEDGAFSMIYVTPERMQMEEFRKMVLIAKERGAEFHLLAIDEAHCVSEWGHDFRVSYLNIPDVARKMFGNKLEKPRVLALTGTASDNVLKDMERDIGISEEKVIQPQTFDRPEIHFRVIKCSSGEKMGRLQELFEGIKEDFPEISEEELRGIVFCIYKTDTSDFGVEAVYRKLAEVYGEEKFAKYYGGDDKAMFRENARRFREDEARIMVATKAFGMGIDKRNVRFTVHFGIPSSIEAYYQEAGRAGRDGQRAMSYVLLSNDFPERNEDILGEISLSDMKRELKRGGKQGRDDVNRILFLHQKNYDRKIILRAVGKILEKMGKISREHDEVKHLVAENHFEFGEFQKGLFRLKVLGVIDDYTIFDYANNEFLVMNKKFDPKSIVMAYGEYVARYQEGQKRHEMNKIRRQAYKNQREFILTQVEILLDFIEGIFEKSRRRAILNMLELAEAGACIKNLDEADKEIRRRVLNYLGATNKELLKLVIEDKKSVRKVPEVILRVRRKDEEKLVAEAKRFLASYPEHPGLLVLVGIMEMIDEKTEAEQAVEEILSAERTSEKYGVSREEFLEMILLVIKYSYGKARDDGKYKKGVEMLEPGLRGKYPEFKERLLEVLPERFTYLFQGEILMENTILSLSRIKYLGGGLWTEKN